MSFALCVHAYSGPDGTHLECVPGELLYMYRVEDSGWVGASEVMQLKWGWVPGWYIQQIDEEAVAVLLPITEELRLGAYRAMTAIHANSTDNLDGYSSPDSNESDALGDEWAVAPPALKHRRPSRIAREPTARPSFDSDVPPTPRLPGPSEASPERAGTKSPSPGVQFSPSEGRSRSRAVVSSSSPSSFVPQRVRAGFRLRSKSNDRGVRSDSEATGRTRRPSVSLRRTRISMFGPPRGLEPHPAEEIARLAARPWYLQPAHSPATGDIVIDADGSIRAGTLEAIAERLTCDPPSRSYEHAFRRAVLLTYEAFTSSNCLFDLLTDQYALEPARELTEDQFIEWKESKLRPTQARVLEVLGMWLALPRIYTDDQEIVFRIREFLQFVTEPDNLAAEARVHLKTIERLISPCAPRPTTSPRRKAPKIRPFPTLSSPGPSPSTLLTPSSSRVGSTSPRLGLASSTSLGHGSSNSSRAAGAGTSPRLEIPSPSPLFPEALGQDQGQGLARAKSGRQSVRSHHSATPSQHSTTPSQHTASSSHRTSSTQHTSSSRRTHSPGSVPSGVLTLDPTALAHHLTLLEAGLYMRVKRTQCLEWHRAGKLGANAADKEKRMSGSSLMSEHTGVTHITTTTNHTTLTDLSDLREFCATSDRLAGWVKWSVLSLKVAAQRAEAVGVWIRVAEKCRQLQNTSSLCAIVAGLSSSDISRLPVTWQILPHGRAQRLEDLVRITSPAGNFAALKVLYASAEGPGVPFVGMYLTALVHASDQFKDYVPAPLPDTESRRESEEGREGRKEEVLSEPATPTQTTSAGAATTPLSVRTAPRMLPNFTKRHKQADVIGVMLKFQQWPYTIVPIPGESGAAASPGSPPPTHLSPSTSPSTTTNTAAPPSSTTTTAALYPYIPSSTSASVPLYASAGGVAWAEEQLARAARVMLGSDWAYERSMRLFDDENGSGIKDILGDAGF